MSAAQALRGAHVAAAPENVHVGMRRIVAVLLMAAAILLLVFQEQIRPWEAVVTRLMVSAVTEGGVAAAGPVFYFGIGTAEVTGLSITTLCSTVVLVVPLLVLAAAIVAATHARIGRVLRALAGGVALVMACNIVRFGSAAWAYQQFGREGFDVIHRYVGSLFVIAGFIAALLLTLVFSLRSRPARRSRRPQTARRSR